jgi:hypothetical protein
MFEYKYSSNFYLGIILTFYQFNAKEHETVETGSLYIY